MNDPNVDHDDIPDNPNADSTPADLRKLIDAIGDQDGFDASDALEELDSLQPGQDISREKMAEILCAGLSGCDQSDPVQFLDDNGLTIGRDPDRVPAGECGTELDNGNCFADDQNMNNAQMVTFVSRLLIPDDTTTPPTTRPTVTTGPPTSRPTSTIGPPTSRPPTTIGPPTTRPPTTIGPPTTRPPITTTPSTTRPPITTRPPTTTTPPTTTRPPFLS